MSQVAWEVFLIFIPVTAICIWYQVRQYISFTFFSIDQTQNDKQLCVGQYVKNPKIGRKQLMNFSFFNSQCFLFHRKPSYYQFLGWYYNNPNICGTNFSDITYQLQENWPAQQEYKELQFSTTLQNHYREQQRSGPLIKKTVSLMQTSASLTITQGLGFIMCLQWNGFLLDSTSCPTLYLPSLLFCSSPSLTG